MSNTVLYLKSGEHAAAAYNIFTKKYPAARVKSQHSSITVFHAGMIQTDRETTAVTYLHGICDCLEEIY